MGFGDIAYCGATIFAAVGFGCLDVDDGGFASFEGSGVDYHFLGFGEFFTVGGDPFLAVYEVYVVAEVAEGYLEDLDFVLRYDCELAGTAYTEKCGVASEPVNEHRLYGIRLEEDKSADGGCLCGAFVGVIGGVVESAVGFGFCAEDAGTCYE